MWFQAEAHVPVRAAVRLAGAAALCTLATRATGIVIASFARSAGLRFGRNLIFLGAGSFPAGPLNVCCEHWPVASMIVGTPVWGGASRLQIGDAFMLDLSGTQIWRAPSCAWDATAGAALRVAAVEEAIHRFAPPDGLSRSTLGEPARDDVQRAAARPLVALVHWLARVTSGCDGAAPDCAVAALIGLGPGLTPSGDDVLVGVLVALAASGRTLARDALAAFLEPRIAERTSAISAAHLRAAMGGEAVEPLHLAIAALGSDAVSLQTAIAAIAAYGHASGWDAAAGAWLVARALSAGR